MSDFLSNFEHDNYKQILNDKKSKKEEQLEENAELEDDLLSDDVDGNKSVLPEHEGKIRRKKKRKRKSQPIPNQSIVPIEEESLEDDIEIDPDYQSKQTKRKAVIGASVVGLLLIGYIIYYQVTRVSVPNFSDKTVVDAKNWASENRMKPKIEQEYSTKVETNGVISQSVAPNKKLKKGSNITFKVSEGANPKEKITLPDFEKMSKSEVEQWISKNKADNVSLIDEYNDKVDKGKFIKLEFTDKEVTKENYLRQDIANVYFSKGKEVFEKNISVPDFSKKSKSDVENWAKKNDIKVDYKEVDSDKIEAGLVVSQTVDPDTKIAKQESMSVSISVGKAVVVPNFANYSIEEATNATSDLQVMTKEAFSDSVPFGQLISQSIEAGKKLTGNDEKAVNVVYSSGRPYIKSFFGQLEGDIPKLIYDNFNSKGACVTYEVYYVDSDKEKGQIVHANAYNQYIATNAHLVFAISNGKYASLPGE